MTVDYESGKTGIMVRRANKQITRFAQFYTLAIEMAVAVILPMLAGLWLDSKTGKSPWFTIGGMILGGAAAIRSAHRTLAESLKELNGDSSDDEPGNRGISS